MNKIGKIFNEIISDESEVKEFLSKETIEEMYKFFLTKDESITAEEFDEYVAEILEEYVQMSENKPVGHLSDEDLEIAGGLSIDDFKKKMAPVALSALTLLPGMSTMVGAAGVNSGNNTTTIQQINRSSDEAQTASAKGFRRVGNFLKKHYKKIAIGVGATIVAAIALKKCQGSHTTPPPTPASPTKTKGAKTTPKAEASTSSASEASTSSASEASTSSASDAPTPPASGAETTPKADASTSSASEAPPPAPPLPSTPLTRSVPPPPPLPPASGVETTPKNVAFTKERIKELENEISTIDNELKSLKANKSKVDGGWFHKMTESEKKLSEELEQEILKKQEQGKKSKDELNELKKQNEGGWLKSFWGLFTGNGSAISQPDEVATQASTTSCSTKGMNGDQKAKETANSSKKDVKKKRPRKKF